MTYIEEQKRYKRRRAKIRQARRRGWSLSRIAKIFEISPQRVGQILKNGARQ